MMSDLVIKKAEHRVTSDKDFQSNIRALSAIVFEHLTQGWTMASIHPTKNVKERAAVIDYVIMKFVSHAREYSYVTGKIPSVLPQIAIIVIILFPTIRIINTLMDYKH